MSSDIALPTDGEISKLPVGPDPRISVSNRLAWVVTYRDNRSIYQYFMHEGQPRGRSFADLPRENMKRLALVTVAEGKLIVSQDFIPGQSPFYRQRNMLGQGLGQVGRVHILGWFDWQGKPTVQMMNVAFVNEATFEVEMGHFVEGRRTGFKYPIQVEDYDYPPIAWT